MIDEIALSALGLVGHALLVDLLILRRQRGLLRWSEGLGRIELHGLAAEPRIDVVPLAFPVGIFRLIGRLRGAHCQHQGRGECKGRGRDSMRHDDPPRRYAVACSIAKGATFTQRRTDYIAGRTNGTTPRCQRFAAPPIYSGKRAFCHASCAANRFTRRLRSSVSPYRSRPARLMEHNQWRNPAAEMRSEHAAGSVLALLRRTKSGNARVSRHGRHCLLDAPSLQHSMRIA